MFFSIGRVGPLASTLAFTGLEPRGVIVVIVIAVASVWSGPLMPVRLLVSPSALTVVLSFALLVALAFPFEV